MSISGKLSNTGGYSRKKVCVIGAGASGLSFLYHVNKFTHVGPEKDHNQGIDVVCFEKHAECGGLWNYTWRVGTELGGELVHSSMYRHLWTNAPKEALEFHDHPHEEHFGHNLPSFLPREMMLDYLKGRMMKHGDLNKYIRYNKKVSNVTYDETEKVFKLQTKDTRAAYLPYTEETFDYVVVATGHFSVPNFPEFPGVQDFQGKVMHAHDYKSAKEFTGMRVLLIGGSYTADDLAVQCMKFGAKSVAISCRRPTGLKWTTGYTEYPILTRIDGNTIYFRDGQQTDVDAIIMCTGYVHSFPFLDQSLTMKPENVYYPKQLYKGVIFKTGGENRLMYLGMQNQAYSFPMFNAQAFWCVQYIAGNIGPLPDQDAMTRDIEKWNLREANVKSVHDIIDLQTDYILGLMGESGYEFDKFDEYRYILKNWVNSKWGNVYTFRDQTHKSVITGNESTKNRTAFMENLDDSTHAILDQFKST